MATASVLLIGGSLRAGSTTGAVLDAAAEEAGPDVAVTAYAGLGELPAFSPDLDPPDGSPPAPVAELRAALAAADAVLFCSPEYAGTLPGSFKNLLDWTVGGGELAGRPVGYVSASGRAGGGTGAEATLRVVLQYLGVRLVPGACVRVTVPAGALDGGRLVDAEARAVVAGAVRALAAAGEDPGAPGAAGGIEISADPRRLDRDVVHAYLAGESYWAKGRTRERQDRAIDGSLCVGAYTADGAQVGFARAVTDRATFAYVADVFVLPAHQGRGIGRQLVGALLDLPELQGLRRMVLATDDAHALYERFGFTPLDDAPKWLQRRDGGI